MKCVGQCVSFNRRRALVCVSEWNMRSMWGCGTCDVEKRIC